MARGFISFILGAILLTGPVRAATLMDEGFCAAQAGFISSAGAALRQIGLRAAAGTDALAGLVRQRQALAGSLKALEDKLSETGADQIALSVQSDGLSAELAALDTRITAEFPRYAELTQPGVLSISDVQALLHPDEAFIYFYVGLEQSYIWAISPTKAGWQRVAAGRETLETAVGRLRNSIDNTGVVRSATALEPMAPTGIGFDRGLSALFYDILLAPLEPVFKTAGHVFIVADGPLTRMPFALFVTDWSYDGEDDDPAALRNTPWMIKSHALTTLPSVESLRIVRQMKPAAPGRSAFLGFGDPVLEGRVALAALSRGPSVMRNGLAVVDQVRALPPLPQTRAELRKIAATLQAEDGAVRLGAEATEAAVKAADLRSAEVIAFATHGLLSGDLAGLDEPALVLTPPTTASRGDDGLLTASEIAELDLDADWVVLSACNTAGGDGPGAEGLSGLARAFLFAGARSILVSHWPVRDDAAARLTSDTFAAMASGTARGKADALRHAMLDLMANESDPSLAHPSAWAPFVLVGEGE
jgi:CHAT domain-containing protein